MVLALVLVLVFPTAAAGTEKGADLEVTAESCVLLEADSGQILYAKNPDQRMAPASMTKLMTLILACERLEKGKWVSKTGW